MLPNRADYKNKKDYKWARKQAQRGRDCYRHRHCVGSGLGSFLTFFALGLGFKELGFEAFGTIIALGVAIVVFRLVPPAPIIRRNESSQEARRTRTRRPPLEERDKGEHGIGQERCRQEAGGESARLLPRAV